MTGTNGKTTTVRMIAHILKLMGRRVGMTTTDGIVIDGRLTRKGDMSGPRSAQTVLQNPFVDTAVFEVARGGMLREGLGYDRNDVAVVTNVTGDHLGLHGIDTVAQLAAVKGVLVDAVPRNGTAVLNADDPLVARMARQSDGRVIYFSMQTQKGEEGFDRVDGHCGRGGAAMVLLDTEDGELLALRQASRTMPLIHSHLIPATLDGRARMNVANALAPRPRRGPPARISTTSARACGPSARPSSRHPVASTRSTCGASRSSSTTATTSMACAA